MYLIILEYFFVGWTWGLLNEQDGQMARGTSECINNYDGGVAS
jgi:hypothetical protein